MVVKRSTWSSSGVAPPGGSRRALANGVSSGGNNDSFHSTIHYGGLELQLEFQPKARVATIQGKNVEMRDDNVILVDDVDRENGMTIIRTLRVDPELPRADNGYPRIEAVLRRSPEILDFLRCETRLPDQRAQAVIDQICSQVLGQ